MTKGKEDRRLILGFLWNCADTKLLLIVLFLIGSLLALFQILPSLSSVTLYCITPSPHPPPPAAQVTTPPDFPLLSGAIRRSFTPIGSAAHLFIQMGAYRGSATSFAIVGLASKPLHIFGKPIFRCEWHPSSSSPPIPSSHSDKFLPDWGFGRIYTVVVINCSFPSPIAASGGRLLLFASISPFSPETTIVSLTESLTNSIPQASHPLPNSTTSTAAPLSSETSARSASASGSPTTPVSSAPEATLSSTTPAGCTKESWRCSGRGWRRGWNRLSAKWIFFFDVDEFIYLQPKTNLDSFMESMAEYSQFTIEQKPMSNKLCLAADAGRTHRMWGFEKLVYRDVKRGVRRNRKYAVQPRRAFSAGVHMSQHIDGKTLHVSGRRIAYFHYHDTVAERDEPCREFVNDTQLTVDGTPFVLDDTLRRVARRVKRFELEAIGPRRTRTRQ
ncbi:hypothetical protein KSP39_PZI006914 [Platanthera zijinensis]|uniref:Glycosyltransferase family 92 protein n=1 Tax=Platanthera zijinensis TaxID=2320716 RepID=A0AAP0BQF4_9ASPA